MASDREGPKATVVLSCEGCRHHQTRGFTVRAWCSAAGGWNEFADTTVTPDWCPHLPGPLVAVPLPKANDDADTRLHPPTFAKAAGWNACRSELIQSARALGQEVTDV